MARLRHAGRAADELCVTPSAVSHRIRQLESHVGIRPFGRSDFTLTADGAANLAKGSTRLRVAVTPTFCRQFVMPRLELFRTTYPDIELILQVSIPLLEVTAEPADLEVRFGTGGYADLEHRMILTDEITPACSPSYLNEFGPFIGVALVRLKMGAAWLESGRLVRLSTRSVPSAHRHHIGWQPGKRDRWECAAFVDWLQQALPRDDTRAARAAATL